MLLPGTGTCVAAIEKCSGRKAEVMGKPNKSLIELIMKEHQISDPKKVCMVGDRLDTDIAITKHFPSMSSLLVFTGVSKREHLHHSHIKPKFSALSLPHILHCYPHHNKN